MKSVNRVTLLGNIGKNPESRNLANASGTLIATTSLATNERYKKGDQWQDRVEWHNLVFYGRLAEIARDYIRKGSKLYIEGHIRTNSWDDKQTREKRYRTEIIVDEISILDSREHAGGSAGAVFQSGAPEANSGEITDEDIPF